MGLLQRKIEAAGIATITLSPIWTFTHAAGAPRVAAIEYPLGLNFGAPGDAAGQRDVLRATLQALENMREPGSVTHLPFQPGAQLQALDHHPDTPPPIVGAIIRRPWKLRRLLARDIPMDDG